MKKLDPSKPVQVRERRVNQEKEYDIINTPERIERRNEPKNWGEYITISLLNPNWGAYILLILIVGLALCFLGL